MYLYIVFFTFVIIFKFIIIYLFTCTKDSFEKKILTLYIV